MSATTSTATSVGGATRAMRTDRGLSWSAAVRLAVVGGRADRARIALTTLAAAAGTMMMLAAAAVVAIGVDDGPYTTGALNEPGLRQGVVLTLLFLCLPLLVFVGQCARVGAPARDRRLAAMRLAGATPRDVVRVAAGETGISAVLGVLAGLGAFAALRALLDRSVQATWTLDRAITYDNGSTGYVTDAFTGLARPLPTDVWPSAAAVLGIAVLVPLASAALTTVALRRVAITPFGVTRREQRPPRRVLPALLFGVGTAGTLLLTTVLRLLDVDIHDSVGSALLVGGVFVLLLVMVLVGLLLGTSAFSVVVGAQLVRSGRPSLLLAGRRLLDAPGRAGRSHAALLMMVLIAAFLQGTSARYAADVGPGSSVSSGTYQLVLTMLTVAAVIGASIAVAGLLVGTAEDIVSRRQVIAGMSAVGVPHSVVRRAVVAENLLPLVPAVVLSATAGILAARGIMTTRVEIADFDEATQTVASVTTILVPVPWSPLLVIVVGALLAVTAATATSLPLLRSGSDPAELRAA